jgi:hypothetical protein
LRHPGGDDVDILTDYVHCYSSYFSIDYKDYASPTTRHH